MAVLPIRLPDHHIPYCLLNASARYRLICFPYCLLALQTFLRTLSLKADVGSEETRQLEAWANAVSTFIVSYTFHNRTEFSVMNSHVETLREYLAPGILVL